MPGPLQHTPACLCCQKDLQALGISNVIVPFWRELPRFMRMPFELGTVFLLLGVTALLALAGAMWPMGRRVLVIALVVYLLHSTRMMHRVSQGYLTAPLQPLADRPGRASLLKQLALLVVFFVAPAAVVVWLHDTQIAAGLLFLAILLLPAAYMTLITTDQLAMALNPAFLVTAAMRIGWSYLLLWGLLLLLVAGSGEVQRLLQVHSSLTLAMAVNGLVSMYFGLVMMGLMGYVAFQHHEIFGQPVQDPTLLGADGKPLPRLKPPDRAQLLIARGKIDEAQSDLERRLRADPSQLELHALYQRLLLARQDREAAAGHADAYIGHLMAARRDAQAWQVYADFAGRFGKLEVRDAEDCVRLAAQGHQNRQGRLALPLLDKFAQRFPDHAEIPRAWLLTARILTEELHDDARGRLVLTALIKRYPEHPVRAEAERFAALLGRLAAAAPRRPQPTADDGISSPQAG